MRHAFVQRRLHPALLIGLALIVCLSIFGINQVTRVGASQDTVLTLVPQGEARTGALITVKLVGRNVANLAGFQGTVRFDGANLRLTSASVERAIGQSGRGVLPLGPVMNDGSVVLGAATCPISDCANPTPQLANRSTNGANGDLDLGTLEFYSGTAGSYTLGLDNVQFVDAQGNRLTVRVEPMVLDVQSS